jgi:hypothetical protein
LSTTLSKIWLSVGPFFFHSFDHNSLVSRPFLARKVSNRSSHDALQNGQRAVSSIQLLVRSTVRSNLVNFGQTWSNLVKALQTLGNVSRTTFRGFLGTVDPIQIGNGSVEPWSTLGQPWSKLPDFWEMCPGPCSEVIWCDKPSSDQAALVRAASFCMPTPEKIPWVKMRL